MLFRRVYPTVLRPQMSAPSVEFWDKYVHKINSFMYSGKTLLLLLLPSRTHWPCVVESLG